MNDDDLGPAPAPVIDRRALLRGGGVLLAGAVAACATRDEPRPVATFTNGAAPGSAAPPDAPPSGTARSGAAGDELVERTFAELAARQADGRDTAASLVARYRQRITALDQAGPTLRSILELNPEADAIAARLDAERAAGKPRGKLHGLPILLKDNIDTGDQLTTTGGSLALAGSRAAADAFVVKRLRDAGAIILGKTNLSEWANFRGKLAVSGWSGRGGQCKNPYALDRTPSGSSSGSAAAVAASLCAAAIGSETDGSITSPSACQGLVGLKPTVGLVSRAGVLPLAASQDTLGPIARTVTDAAILLTAIAGADPGDPVGLEPIRQPAPRDVDYTSFLDKRALSGARFGVPRKGFFGVHRGVDQSMAKVLATLRDAGATLIDVELPMPSAVGDDELEVLTSELRIFLDRYLAARGADAKVHSIAEVVAFNRANPAELAWFGQEWFEEAITRPATGSAKYRAARARCVQHARAGVLDKLIAAHKLDAFVAPTGMPAWVTDPVNGDSGTYINTPMLPAVAGYPHLTVPGPPYKGLPIGVSWFGPAYAEGKLLGYGYAFEQLTHHRQPPRYLATVDERAT
ncbi:MAG TPA: amidase [Kofleriaceae bacterium]